MAIPSLKGCFFCLLLVRVYNVAMAPDSKIPLSLCRLAKSRPGVLASAESLDFESAKALLWFESGGWQAKRQRMLEAAKKLSAFSWTVELAWLAWVLFSLFFLDDWMLAVVVSAMGPHMGVEQAQSLAALAIPFGLVNVAFLTGLSAIGASRRASRKEEKIRLWVARIDRWESLKVQALSPFHAKIVSESETPVLEGHVLAGRHEAVCRRI